MVEENWSGFGDVYVFMKHYFRLQICFRSIFSTSNYGVITVIIAARKLQQQQPPEKIDESDDERKENPSAFLYSCC